MGTTMPPNPVEQTREVVKQSGSRTVKDLLVSDEFRNQVAMSLPRHMKPERFIRVALNATLRQPELLQCQRESLFLALLQLSAYGLEADGRNAHLIPFWDTKTCTCGHAKEEHRQGQCSKCKCSTCQSRRLVQLIIDYKGLASLVRRSGDVSYIHADIVLQGDEWDFKFGSDAFLLHKPNLELQPYNREKPNERKMVAAYSFVKLKDGSEDFIVISPADVEAIRKRSKSPEFGPWKTDYPEMAKKTVFRRHSKWLPLSPEVQDAITADDDGEEFSANASLVLDNVEAIPDSEPEPVAETLADRVAKAAAQQQSAAAASEKSTGEEPKAQPAKAPAKKDKPPKDLYDYVSWDAAQISSDWERPWIKVEGKIYQMGETGYLDYKG